MKFDWRSSFGLDPSKNPYFRLTEAERYKLGIRWLALMVFAIVLFAVIRWLGLRTG